MTLPFLFTKKHEVIENACAIDNTTSSAKNPLDFIAYPNERYLLLLYKIIHFLHHTNAQKCTSLAVEFSKRQSFEFAFESFQSVTVLYVLMQWVPELRSAAWNCSFSQHYLWRYLWRFLKQSFGPMPSSKKLLKKLICWSWSGSQHSCTQRQFSWVTDSSRVPIVAISDVPLSQPVIYFNRIDVPITTSITIRFAFQFF